MTATLADCQRVPQVSCVCSKCHAYRLANRVKPKTLQLRNAVELILPACDIDPMKAVVTFGDAVNYGWPQKYLGQTYAACLKDCTSVMLAAVLHAHIPYLPVTFRE